MQNSATSHTSDFNCPTLGETSTDIKHLSDTPAQLPLRPTDLSHQHFVDQDPHPPPVHRSCVRRFRQHLRSQELWCAAEGAGSIPVAHALLAEAEVGNFQVAFCIQQQVVQLQVSVNSGTTPCCWRRLDFFTAFRSLSIFSWKWNTLPIMCQTSAHHARAHTHTHTTD